MTLKNKTEPYLSLCLSQSLSFIAADLSFLILSSPILPPQLIPAWHHPSQCSPASGVSLTPSTFIKLLSSLKCHVCCRALPDPPARPHCPLPWVLTALLHHYLLDWFIPGVILCYVCVHPCPSLPCDPHRPTPCLIHLWIPVTNGVRNRASLATEMTRAGLQCRLAIWVQKGPSVFCFPI